MNNKGFTLIEMLIVVSMIAVLSTFIFVDYSTSNEVFELEKVAQKLAQDLRLAQQKALSGIEGSAATNAYGIYFSSTSNDYLVYENNNANPYYDGEDLIVETITIPSKIGIESLKSNDTSLSNLSVSFFPPVPTVYIEDSSSGTEGSIILYLINDTSEKRVVKINNSGRIEIAKI